MRMQKNDKNTSGPTYKKMASQWFWLRALVLIAISFYGFAGSQGAIAGQEIGVNIEGVHDWDRTQMFADLMKQARHWGSVSVPYDEAAQEDANGWPTGDATAIFVAENPHVGGKTYKLSFTGNATVSLVAMRGDSSITNKVYNASTNTTTADVNTAPLETNLWLAFQGQVNGVNTFANPSFETPALAPGSAGSPAGATWSFTQGYGGIASNGSVWNNPPALDGTQVGLLINSNGTNGGMSQSVNFSGGNYYITFQAAQRYMTYPQSIKVYVDNTLITTIVPTSTSFAPYTTPSFSATSGAHTITFAGGGGNFSTAFIDSVAIKFGGVKNVKLMRPGHQTTDLFNQDFLARLKYFTTLRYMGYLETNFNPAPTWAQRMLPTNASMAKSPEGFTGAAWEYIILLANATGKDVWINVPHLALGSTYQLNETEYVTKLAQLFKYGSDGVNPYTSVQANPVYPPLDPNLKIYVEHSNEMWNGGFPQTVWAGNQAEAAIAASDPDHLDLCYDGTTDKVTVAFRLAAKGSMKISDIFRSVFGDADMMTRVRPVVAGQFGNIATYYGLDYIDARYMPSAHYFYAVAGAPYIDIADDSLPLTVNQIFSEMDTYRTNILNPAIYSLKNYAQTKGLKLVAYEGGQGLSGSDNATNKLAAQTDQNMKTETFNLMNTWQQAGGDVFMYTSLASKWDNSGYWGLSNDIAYDIDADAGYPNSEAYPNWGAIKEFYNSNTFANPSFETPALAPGSAGSPAGATWSFTQGYGGIASNGSVWNNPPALDGTQVGLLINSNGTNGGMSQSVNFSGGNYYITFQAAQRYMTYPQSIKVYVDNTLITTIVPTSTSFAPYTTPSFSATSGAHTITFAGGGGNFSTAFIDSVAINVGTIDHFVNPSFETPALAPGSAGTPAGATWSFTQGYGGIASNGSVWNNPPALDGTQVGLLINSNGTNGGMSQSVNFSGGNYYITFQAAQRYMTYPQSIKVYVDNTLITTIVPTSTSFAPYTTPSFSATSGAHTITFAGGGGNFSTAFIDSVAIVTQ